MTTVDSLSMGRVPRWMRLLADSRISFDAESVPKQPIGDPRLSRIDVIQQGLLRLTEPGQVVELRVLGISGKRRTDSGYFDDLKTLATAAMAYDGKAEGVYFTLNPVNPALMARATNRVREYAQQTTADVDIVRRTNLPIDFDPVRPAGISSTGAEHQAALQRAWACRAWLIAQGWREPVVASSGNGAHLLYAIDLPNSTDSTELIKRCLQTLAEIFSDDSVKVDVGTSNASRIFKLYGTLTRKGDNTLERPHRRAVILTAPEQRSVVSREQLQALAAAASSASPTPRPAAKTQADNYLSHQHYGRAALETELARLSSAPHGNRNHQLFKSSAALFSLVASQALDHQQTRRALLDTARQIGLPDSEARRTISSGEKRGFAQPRDLPRHQPNPGPGVANNMDKSRPVVDKPSDFMMHVDALDDLPPIRWLIQDLLPANSLVELHGAPGSGKTQVTFDMAQTLAASGQTVIYVVAEGLQGYRSRKRAWQQFRKRSGGNLFIWSQAVHLFESAAVSSFIQAIQPKQPALIVFDTLSRCSLGADENNQKDMGLILDALDKVRRETGATVVAVHHTNATGARERGSTVIRGGMDVMLEVSKEDDLLIVSCVKMKDAEQFAPLYFKPVLVDIGEEKPVPVLVPAERRTQTRADKLSVLQLEVLKSIGMEMFAASGIRISQLDELLPPDTKRASKYHSLNTLIRLGYVDPHVKGEPYCITEVGRQQLSNIETSTATSKSNLSKASPNSFIWTLPESCPMSSPIPHTFRCGIDETFDTRAKTENKTTSCEPNELADPTPVQPESKLESGFPGKLSNVSAQDLAGHEAGDAPSNPATEMPNTASAIELVALYLLPGLVTSAELFSGYERARDSGQGEQFLHALRWLDVDAADLLMAWIQGKRPVATILIPRPANANSAPQTLSDGEGAGQSSGGCQPAVTQ